MLFIVGKMFFLIGVILFLMEKVNLNDTISILYKIDMRYFIAALLVLLLQIMIATNRWQKVLSELNMTLSYMASIKILWIGLFFNQFLPSNVGGDLLRGYYLKNYGFSTNKSVFAVLLDRILGVFGLVLLIMVMLPLFFYTIDDALPRWLLLVVLAISITAIISFFLLDKLPGFIKLRKIIQSLILLSKEGTRLILRKKPGVFLISVSIMVHLFSILAVIILSVGLDSDASWIGVFLIMPLVTLLMVLPISFAGWGVREGVMVVGMEYVGVSVEESLAISILYGICVLVVSLPGMGIWVFRRYFAN